ncbi:stage V sporulation protein AB [Cohnella thailandensis]|uniref:Stage V sporulation protein AB n=1 Tax=Cohnella thailandensis TaxID=557557 RepID=A0A841SX03_9BACL|nr:stage V sporulation protein AB [Cohnella thailandensis]MBB6635459.1 stage V sporulation protein AB [Cohnella thailandensis]MBP1974839.1 stage V sporulation protein AB [Cohnella thailandensis]
MIEAAGFALVSVVALAGGFAVGSAFIALLIVLDLIPRLVQLTRAHRRSWVFESALLAGAVYWCCADFFGWRFVLPQAILLIPAVFQGVFVGMMSAALTEVLNVIPILTKQLGLKRYLFALLIALALGKTTGSLVDWLILQPR